MVVERSWSYRDILYDSIYLVFWKRQKLQGPGIYQLSKKKKKKISYLQRSGLGEQLDCKGAA